MAVIGFVGDVYPGPEPGLRITAEVRERLAGFDLVVANLEGPITAIVEPAVEKGTHLRTRPAGVEALSAAGIGLVSVANNHMFDFGEAGFAETVAALDADGVAWVGAGADLAAARAPRVLEVAGVTVGFLAYSAAEIETITAGDHSAGCAPLSPQIMEADVAGLAGAVDVPVVLVHWGFTGYEMPAPRHRALASALVAAGATLVVGSHPHVLQGVRRSGPALVAYSLGDFAFYPASAFGKPVGQYRARQTGMILGVEIDADGVVGHTTTLTRQRGRRVALEASARRQRAFELASRRVHRPERSAGRSWRGYVARRTVARSLRRLAPWRWRTIGRGTIRGLGVAVRQMLGRGR